MAKTIESEPLKMSALRAPRAPSQPRAPLSGLRFVSVATQNDMRQDVLSYNPYGDEIVLDMVYEQGSVIQSTPGLTVTGTWQLIEGRSNQVVADFRAPNVSPIPAPFISWAWNAGTADNLRLNWLNDDLFSFRAFIEATYHQDGKVNVDFFDVSAVKWFRLKPFYEV